MEVLELVKSLKNIYDGSDQELYLKLRTGQLDSEENFYVVVCFGMLEGFRGLRRIPYDKHVFLKMDVYEEIENIFKRENNGIVIHKDENYISLICSFPKAKGWDFTEEFVKSVSKTIVYGFGVSLNVGIGSFGENPKHMSESYRNAKFAYELYFFVQSDIIRYDSINMPEIIHFDRYEDKLEEIYHSILSKDEKACVQIEEMLQLIEKLHYGKRYMAINRCIMFVGELGKKLKDLNPVAAQWRQEQEDIQENLWYMTTYEDVCAAIMTFYTHLLPVIYRNVEQKNVYEILQIKKYIQKNYMNDISLKDMADLMCVSHSYFSTCFKNATGRNFKSYLTEVRMEMALSLVLRTNMKSYEISEAVGYNNVRRFVDAFKNVYKMSPMEYRIAYKNEPVSDGADGDYSKK